MKSINKYFRIVFMCLIVVQFSCCETDDGISDPSIEPTPTETTGQVLFWTASDLGVGSISVTCNGSTKTIGSYYDSYTPDCGASGSANFTLDAGTYNYNASGGSLSWNGTVTVTAGSCRTTKLTGSGSGGSGGGSSAGNAMFWTASDLGVGSISVTCNGSTRAINSYYSSGTPDCGASGAANFSLDPGTYAYSASGGSLSWNGTVTVTAGGCNTTKLTGSGSGGSGGGGSSVGDAMFWTASDLGVGSISVTCNGSTRTINSYYNSGTPDCGASGAANFSLNPGSYTYSASGGSLSWNGTITVSAGGCSKFQLTGSGSGGGSGGGGSSTGNATFWTASDLGVGSISVTCNGSTRTINSYYNSGTPDCGASGAANFTLNPGSYSYSASGGSLSWSGTITVSAGGCSKLKLTGNGSGGGSGGGGSSTGNATFWTASDLGIGSITVTCNGSTRTINSYYSSGTPDCGASGSANFTLNPGSYSYSASAGSYAWNGTITVSAGGCRTTRLTL